MAQFCILFVQAVVILSLLYQALIVTIVLPLVVINISKLASCLRPHVTEGEESDKARLYLASSHRLGNVVQNFIRVGPELAICTSEVLSVNLLLGQNGLMNFCVQFFGESCIFGCNDSCSDQQLKDYSY